MVDQELEDKVQQSINEGYSREEILEVMESQGYKQHEIGKAIAIADGSPDNSSDNSDKYILSALILLFVTGISALIYLIAFY